MTSSCSYMNGTSKICFQPRECNKVAYELARFIVKQNVDLYCIETRPDWLMKSININIDVCNPSID